MKKNLLFLFSLISASTYAQNCTELFISEYIEGSGNNKAIEIYNPTKSPIELSNYSIARGNNGSFPSAETFINLPAGTIAPNKTYVFVLDKRNPNGTGQEVPVAAALQAKADAFICPRYEDNQALYFNGNDAVVLYKGKTLNAANPLEGAIDIFGKVGQDPGRAWTNDASADYTDANGGRWLTLDKTLIRKKTVKGGVTSNPDKFNAQLQWDTLPRDNFNELKAHTCDCANISGINDNEAKLSASIYPNPTGNEGFNVATEQKADKIEIFDIVGKSVALVKPESNNQFFNSANLKSGIYLIKIELNGAVTTKKVTVK